MRCLMINNINWIARFRDTWLYCNSKSIIRLLILPYLSFTPIDSQSVVRKSTCYIYRDGYSYPKFSPSNNLSWLGLCRRGILFRGLMLLFQLILFVFVLKGKIVSTRNLVRLRRSWNFSADSKTDSFRNAESASQPQPHSRRNNDPIADTSALSIEASRLRCTLQTSLQLYLHNTFVGAHGRMESARMGLQRRQKVQRTRVSTHHSDR